MLQQKNYVNGINAKSARIVWDYELKHIKFIV